MKKYIRASSNPAYTVEHAYWSAFNGVRFQQPEPAIKAWLKKNDTFYGDVAIYSASAEDTRRLYEWVVNNQEAFGELAQKYFGPHYIDYVDVCKRKLENADFKRGWIPPFTTIDSNEID